MFASISELISDGVAQLGLTLSNDQCRQLADYIELLNKWNKTYNLTAIKEPEKMVVYHLLDSLAVANYFSADQRQIIDVGAGAGLPGIPLSILFPDKSFTLLDSNGKKTRFMTQTKIELGLSNCRVVHDRVERWRPEQRFDVAVSRAFSSIKAFIDSVVHLLRPEGKLYAMKGKRPDTELLSLPEQVALQAVWPVQVPQLNEERHLVVLRKVS